MRSAVVFLLTVLCATIARADEPLIDAAARGDKVAAQQLIASGASVDARGADNATALIVAALSGEEDIARTPHRKRSRCKCQECRRLHRTSRSSLSRKLACRDVAPGQQCSTR